MLFAEIINCGILFVPIKSVVKCVSPFVHCTSEDKKINFHHQLIMGTPINKMLL